MLSCLGSVSSLRSVLHPSECGSAKNAPAGNVYEMGWLAQAGYQVMHRQSLTCRSGDSGMGGGERCAYGVLNTAPEFQPTPDYWLAVLHKKLMGTAVLNTTTRSSGQHVRTEAGPQGGGAAITTPKGLERVVRLFAHCGKAGGVALMFANPQPVPMPVTLPPTLRAAAREVYLLTPAPDGSGNPPLQSKKVALNGKPLEMVGAEQTELPELAPRRQAGGGPLTLPALSYGFVVLPAAAAGACK